MTKLESIVARLPEATRVDIEAWGSEPTFRVQGKNFVFTNRDATSISIKVSKEEAAAVVATDPQVQPVAYGLGRHGWIRVTMSPRAPKTRWREVEEWIRTSYMLIAPKRLARVVADQDGVSL